MRVKVAFNRHKKLYSIRHKGKVIAYRERVLLANVCFEVSQKGREKALREGKRNVHAFAVGEWVRRGGAFGIDENGRDFGVRIHYDPFKHISFVTEDGNSVNAAWGVLLNERGVTACYLGLGCEK